MILPQSETVLLHVVSLQPPTNTQIKIKNCNVSLCIHRTKRIKKREFVEYLQIVVLTQLAQAGLKNFPYCIQLGLNFLFYKQVEIDLTKLKSRMYKTIIMDMMNYYGSAWPATASSLELYSSSLISSSLEFSSGVASISSSRAYFSQNSIDETVTFFWHNCKAKATY